MSWSPSRSCPCSFSDIAHLLLAVVACLFCHETAEDEQKRTIHPERGQAPSPAFLPATTCPPAVEVVQNRRDDTPEVILGGGQWE
eukprot:2225306-Rhodomonas_salina.2